MPIYFNWSIIRFFLAFIWFVSWNSIIIQILSNFNFIFFRFNCPHAYMAWYWRFIASLKLRTLIWNIINYYFLIPLLLIVIYSYYSRIITFIRTLDFVIFLLLIVSIIIIFTLIWIIILWLLVCGCFIILLI